MNYHVETSKLLSHLIAAGARIQTGYNGIKVVEDNTYYSIDSDGYLIAEIRDKFGKTLETWYFSDKTFDWRER